MEQWKTMEGYDGVFSISNTMKILRSEHMTIGEFGGKQFPVRAKEELFEGLEEVATEYKGKHLLFNMLQETKKYFTKEELLEGKEVTDKKLEEEKKKLEETFNKPYVESLAGEVWKPLKGYSQYEVSDAGRFKRVEHTDGRGEVFYEKLIFPSKIEGKKGLYIRLWNDKYKFNETKLAAKVIADTFLKNPNNLYIVHHLDGNPFNIKVENLKWYDDSPSNYYMQKETKSIFKSLTDVCRAFHISKVKVKNCLAEGKPIKEGVTIVEKTSNFISSLGNVPVDMRIVEMKETSVPVETKKVILKKNKTVSNPNKRSRSILPILKLENIPATVSSITTTVTTLPLEEKWEPIPRYSEYKVSNKGEVKRLFHWESYGRLSDVELEKSYEKNGLMYVKIHNSYDFPIEIPVERLVAETYLTNPNDYYLLEHIDGDYKNNTITNLRWIKDTKGVMLKDNATKEECSIKAVAEVLNLTEKEVYDFVITFRSIGDFSFSIVTEEETKLEEKQEVVETVKTVVEDAVEEVKEEISVELDVLTGIVNQSNEIWKVIPYFENYSVSNKGRVVSHAYIEDGKVVPAKHLKREKTESYAVPFVTLVNDKVTMFRAVDTLVAEAFVDNVNHDLWVYHQNGMLNDCRAENLVYTVPDKPYDTIKVLPYGYVYAGPIRAMVETKLGKDVFFDSLKSGHEIKGFRFVYLKYMKTNAPILTDETAKTEIQETEHVNTDIMNVLNDLAKASEEVTAKSLTYKEICTSTDWYCAYGGVEDRIEYFISKKGDAKKFVDGVEAPVKIKLSKSGRKQVCLGLLSYRSIARLVAQKWLENPNGYKTVLHKGDISDDSVENLYWSASGRKKTEKEVAPEQVKKVEPIQEVKAIEIEEKSLTKYSEVILNQFPEWRILYEDEKLVFIGSKKGEIKKFLEGNEIEYKIFHDHAGTMSFTMGKVKTITFAQAIARAYIPNPNGYKYVCHKDGDNQNNSVQNLYWSDKTRKKIEKNQNEVCKETEKVEVAVSSLNEIENSSEWKPIDFKKDLDGFKYFISCKGDIKRFDKDGIEHKVNVREQNNGRVIDIPKIGSNKLIARFVAEAFIENTYNYHFVKHKNDLLDDSVQNLFWAKSSRETWEDNALFIKEQIAETRETIAQVENIIATVKALTESVKASKLEEKEMPKEINISAILVELAGELNSPWLHDLKLEVLNIADKAADWEKRHHVLNDEEYADYQKWLKIKETIYS